VPPWGERPLHSPVSPTPGRRHPPHRSRCIPVGTAPPHPPAHHPRTPHSTGSWSGPWSLCRPRFWVGTEGGDDVLSDLHQRLPEPAELGQLLLGGLVLADALGGPPPWPVGRSCRLPLPACSPLALRVRPRRSAFSLRANLAPPIEMTVPFSWHSARAGAFFPIFVQSTNRAPRPDIALRSRHARSGSRLG